MASTSLDILRTFAPNGKSDIIEGVNNSLNKYAATFGVDTPKRLAMFLAQAAHETMGFRTLQELASGAKYEGRVKGLGNTQKGDGVRYKGRGIFQTTGRANYKATSLKIFNDTRLLDNPEILEQPEYATLSALHFWKDHSLNALADAGNITLVTRKINGGTNGLSERKSYFKKITNLLYYNPLGFGFSAGANAVYDAGVNTVNTLKKKSNNSNRSNSNFAFFEHIQHFIFGNQ